MIKTLIIYNKKFILKTIPFILILFTAIIFTGCGIRKNACLPHISNRILTREFSRLTQFQIDSLKTLYANNKILVDEFIEPTLIALSFYPDLKDVKIEFKYSKEKTTMAARPVTSSLLTNRKYVVSINNQKDFEGILLKDVPFNAKIGILGHELSHIADYEKFNFWGILGTTFRYLDKSRKPLFEREIDKATIIRGLGWQLYDWAVFSMHTNEFATEEYKKFKRNTYMTPEEIEHIINSFSKYYIYNQ